MLAEYKAQQGVERGFRFLKDPWFMVDLRISKIAAANSGVDDGHDAVLAGIQCGSVPAKSRKCLLGSRNVGFKRQVLQF